MNARRPPRIIPPNWLQTASGLWVPTSLRDWDRRISVELGRDSSGQAIVAVLNRLPDSSDQLDAFVDERAIGLPISTLPTQINRAAAVSFESAAFYVSGIGMATAEAPATADAQRQLAQTLIVDPDIAAGIDEALTAGKGSVVFAQQHLAALARLAVKHADRSRPENLDCEIRTLERALLGCSALAMSDTERLTGEHVDPFDAVAFLVHNGAYYLREPLLEATARNAWLYQDLAESADARDHPEWRDLDACGVTSTPGPSIAVGSRCGISTPSASRRSPQHGRWTMMGISPVVESCPPGGPRM